MIEHIIQLQPLCTVTGEVEMAKRDAEIASWRSLPLSFAMYYPHETSSAPMVQQ